MSIDKSTERQRNALSLIEVVASTMIVGMMTVAALNSLGAATKSSESIGNRAVALGLADELMSEILQHNYEEPTQTVTFGRESGESATVRSTYDDVDDYNGWSQSPPRYRDGAVMPNRTGWRHRVVVARVSPSDPTQTVFTEQGAKLIVVTIEHDDVVIEEQYAIRTDLDET